MVELFANSRDPDQMPHSVVADLGLHCLPNTLLGSPDYNGFTASVTLTVWIPGIPQRIICIIIWQLYK